MSRICLDTCAYSQFKRGHAPVVEVLCKAREVLVPVITLGELRTGFRMGGQLARNEDELKTFLAHPLVRVLEVDEEASSLYSELVTELRRQGTPIPTNDLWIAALAAREGASVLTYDAHFEQIRRIGVLLLARE
jgi:tRNA(fMet)-specific endonuclease VapC